MEFDWKQVGPQLYLHLYALLQCMSELAKERHPKALNEETPTGGCCNTRFMLEIQIHVRNNTHSRHSVQLQLCVHESTLVYYSNSGEFCGH